MNRITKGSLAIGAGLMLALGGAGSIAYWQAQTTAGATQFTTGDLSISPYADHTTWKVNGRLVAAANLGSVLLVPGTTVEWTQEYDIDRNGTDLYIELDAVVGGISMQGGGPLQPITVTAGTPTALDPANIQFTRVGTSDTYKVTGKGGFTVTTTLDWPFGFAADTTNDYEEKTLDFTGSTMTVRQVAAPVTP